MRSSSGGFLARLGLAIASLLAAWLIGSAENACAGEWVWRNPLPQGNPLEDVAFANSQEGWAVGAGGTILRTRDGGAHWASQDSGTSSWLSSVDFVDSYKGWVTGAGCVLHTVDGGGHWTLQSPGTFNHLYDIDFVDDDHGWAVGVFGTILATTDGGAHWAAQTSNTSGHIRGVKFVDSSCGWAVGPRDQILSTTDGGSHWTVTSVNTADELTSIAFVDRNRGWAVGGSGVVLATADGGAHWVRQSTGTARALQGVAFSDATHGCAVGGGDDIWITSNGGIDWTRRTTGRESASFFACASIATRSWCVVADLGEIYTTADNGSSWMQRHRDSIVWTGAWYPRSVAFGDSDHGWTVGDDGLIAITTDGGKNWALGGHRGADGLLAVDAPDAAHAWAVGERGKILAALADGTWIVQQSGATGTLRAVSFVDTSSGCAVGDAGLIAITTDGGSHWATSTVGAGVSLRGVSFVDANHGWAAGWDSAAPAGPAILATQDGGKHWTRQTAPSYYELSAITFVDELHGWVSGEGGTILRTVDGGQHWTQGNSGTLDHLRSIAFNDFDHGYAVGGGGLILSTSDGGAHWATPDCPSMRALTGVAIRSPGRAVAVGYQTILGYADDEVAPTTTLSRLPEPGPADWSRTDVVVSLSATDNPGGSGVAAVRCRIGSDPVRPYSGAVTFSADGVHTIEYSSIDASGNAETTKTATVRIDRTPPATTDNLETTCTGVARFALVPTDAVSGVATTTWVLDGVPGGGRAVVAHGLGAHVFEYRSVDVAGNAEDTRTVHFEIVPPTVAPRLSLSASKTVLPYSWWDVTLAGRCDLNLGVVLQKSLNGSTWSDAGVTWPSGAGSAKLALDRTTYFRLSFGGGEEWLPGVSNTVKITLVPYIPTPSGPSVVRRNRRFAVSTNACASAPRVSDQLTFRFSRYEKVRGRWQWVLRKSVRGAASGAEENAVTYRTRTSLPRAGRWKVVACYGANERYGAVTSGARVFRVR